MLQAGAYIQKGDVRAAENALKSGIETNRKSTALYLSLADLYLQDKRVDDGIAIVQKVIDIDPKEIRHKLTLANLYWDSGKEQEAAEVLNNIVVADEKNEERWIQNAGFFVSKKRAADAEKVLKEALQKNPKSPKIRFALSEIYVNTKQVNNAVDLLKECLTIKKDSKDPENIQAKNSLAKIYIMRQELTEARTLIDDVIKNSPKNVEAHFLKGNIFLSEEDGTGAVSEFRTVANEWPEFIPVYVKLAEAHAMTREPHLALDTLQTALKIEPNSKDALRAIGRIYFMQGNYSRAEDHMKKLAGLHPDDIDIKSDLGDFFLARKDFKQAENTYADIKRKAPTNPSGYIRMGGLYAMQGNPGRATAEFEQAYKLSSQSQQILTILVQSYMENKKYASAVALCEEKIKENPKDSFSYNLLGQVLGAQKNYKGAEELFQKAISLQPTWPVPHNNLAHLYLIQGQTANAIKKYQESIKYKPENVTAYLSLAQIHCADKNFSKAIDIYSKLLKKWPNLWVVANDLAFLLSEHSTSTKELEKAMKIARHAQKLRPEEGAVLDTVGWIYYKQGDAKRAHEFVARARQKTPGNSVIAYHMGMVHYKLGKRAEAKDQLKKALESKDDFFGKQEAEKTLAMISTHEIQK